jgi:hypothetical protein
MSTNSSETAQIIPLFGPRPKLGKRILPIAKNSSNPQYEEGISDTAGDQRLRSSRRDVWREADTAMAYWRMAMKMHNAIARAQSHGLPEGDLHAPIDHGEFHRLCAKWRQAWARLMLTPAADMLSVAWKRATQGRKL